MAKKQTPDLLLAGERDGLPISAELTGSLAFDVGNSPREFTPARVNGMHIAMTTTNGTRALRACAPAATILAASFLNLGATAGLIGRLNPSSLLLVCSGTFEEAAYEDILGAGALCDQIWERWGAEAADSAHVARQLFKQVEHDLLGAVSQARNGRRLLERPALRDDVAFCVQRDIFDLAAVLEKDGWIKRGQVLT
jgi:2-phosphosulfolactate phosphatase